ncbi:MAG: hypothetical protein HOP33_09520 [Verrucomicrobia bacterium]|nr:hypothetical protein [Verrucomicrobiota bacterium]
MNKNLVSAASLLFAVCIRSLAMTPDQSVSAHLAALARQGIPQESILGADENGVPRVCGTGIQNAASLVSGGTNSTSNLLPAGVRSWEFIPNVIRNDGVEWFRLEVDVNGPATSVRWGLPPNYPSYEGLFGKS